MVIHGGYGAQPWSRPLPSTEYSYALIIDKPIMDLLKIDSETSLEVTTDGKSLLVTPVADPARRKRFEEALESINKRYAKAFKRLAN